MLLQHSRPAARRPLFETLALETSDWEGEVSRSSADYVRWFQAALNRIDGAGLAVDGVSGSLTKAAVRSFQSRRGLAADGIVGPITEGALVAAGAGSPPGSVDVAPPAVTPAPAPGSGTAARLRVPESDLIALLPSFAPYGYGEGRYPWLLPGISASSLAPPQQTNCCCFVEALLWRAWSKRHGAAFQWNSQRHGQVMIFDAKDLFSPTKAYTQAGIATALPAGAPPTSWCVVQGWTQRRSGHTFIVVARHAATDRVLTLEANSAYKLSGVGCRNFGNLRDLPGLRPPARWWESSSAPRWADIARYYDAGVSVVKLGVGGANWAGLPS